MLTNLADCVEARILGVALSDDDSSTVRIALRSQAGKRFSIIARGVDRFIANEFREKNIVDRVDVWNSQSATDGYYELLKELILGFDSRVELSVWAPLIEVESNAIQRGKKVFLSVEAVYGATILLLAREFSMKSDED